MSCQAGQVPGETDLERLLAAIDPLVAHDEVVVVTLPDGTPADALAMVREPEGCTYVLTLAEAERLGLDIGDRGRDNSDDHDGDGDGIYVASWITLRVHSSLDAVGLTAAFSTALARAGISCNVLAGAHHDHILVPPHRADEAVDVLRSLARPR